MTINKEKILSLWQHRKARRYVLRTLAAFVLVSVLGFFAAPPLVKSLLIEKLAATLHRPVTIKSVSINPYALSVTVDGLAIQEREGGQAFASFDSLYLNLESASLFRGGPVFSEIRLVNPKISVVRFPDNRYNFSDLIDELMAKPKSSDPTPAFSLNNIQLTGGLIAFDDRPAGAKHVVDDVNLTLPFVSNIGQATEAFVEPAFAARIDGAPLVIKGRSKPFSASHESELLINLDAVQLAKYHEYIPFQLPIKVASGALDGDLKIVFRQEANKPPQLSVSGQTTLTGLLVNESSGAPLLSVKRLDLVLGASDLLRSRFVIDRVIVDTPQVRARIGKEGTINWQEVLAKVLIEGTAPAASAAAAPVEWAIGEAKVNAGALRWIDESRSKPVQGSVEDFTLQLKNLDSKGASDAEFDLAWRVDAQEWLKVESFAIKGGRANLVRRDLFIDELAVRGSRMLIRRAADGSIESLKPPTLLLAQAVKKEPGPAWKVVVAKYRGADLGLRFEDNAFSPPATQVISDLNAEIDNISTDPGQTTTLATRFKLNDKGRFEFAGSVRLVPLEADIKLDLKGVELLPLQPYFGGRLNIAVTRGQLSLAGDLEIRPGKGGGSLAPPGLAGRFKGAATIGDFAAVDKFNDADFLRWKSLHIGQVDLRLNEDSLAIGEIALSDFFARAIINAEGKLNLLQMVRRETPAPVAPVATEPSKPAPSAPVAGKAVAPVAAVKAPAFPMRIDRVTLQAGSVNFTDNFIKPNYSARLRQIGGRVSGLSTAEGSIAEVELRGSYDDIAPLNLTARVNPFSAQPYLDLQADVKGLDMSPFSPYSGKYAGYAIEKGKLSLFVKYKIENKLLTAENRIFLDQLTFGEPVESPEATKLPVNLALALLKNRRGEIDINLPISGSLDDPQFSVGGLVLKMIGNLFVKAVSSPFAMLGSLFAGGGSGEMSTIEFDYGRSALSPEALGRLENLAKALVDRPALKLEIDGRVDSERDREALKQVSIERKVRAQKRDELAKSGAERSSGEVIEVSAAEYPALLERVYQAEKFPKPRNLVGLVKSIPVDEMEKLILTNTTIDDNDLRALGDRRARVVRDWLLAHEVEAERIFLLPSRIEATDGKSEGDAKGKGSRVDFSLK